MPKYRHKVTGRVSEHKNTAYADAVSALERVDDDTKVTDCDDCGFIAHDTRFDKFLEDDDPNDVDDLDSAFLLAYEEDPTTPDEE